MSTNWRMDDVELSANYPYLSYGDSRGNWTERNFYWEQTHDLEGEKGVVYTPIAEVL